MILTIARFLLFAVLVATSGCLFGDFPLRREVREREQVSNLTVDGDSLYFGAGYHLYRLSIPSRSIETIYTTDRVPVEQPVVANGVAYFGGSSGVDRNGNYGEKQAFFAVDLQSKKVKWRFPLGVGGYGTFGTFPALAGDRILVCAREHLHSIDRDSGKEIWHLDNWMGKVSDGVTLPYIYKDRGYFQIAEEHIAGSQKGDDNDGHWAEVNLESGERSIIPIAEHPGTWEDSSGTGFGLLIDGVIYGKTRIDRFGALDLEAKKILWEVQGENYSRPAVNDKYVFTVRENQIQSLDRRSGHVVWSIPVGVIADTGIDRSKDRIKWDYENYWSRRFVLADETLIVQGSKGIVGLNAKNGKLLWFNKTESAYSDAQPIVEQKIMIAVSDKDCSLLGLDITTGNEVWRVKIPECTTYYLFDD